MMAFTVKPDQFQYNDSDSYEIEMAEFYSYSEEVEFITNLRAFEDEMIKSDLSPSWRLATDAKKKLFIMKLLDKLDINNRIVQMKAAKCILYIAQGCWAEVQTNLEQKACTRVNSILLYRLGTFMSFVQLLYYERNNVIRQARTTTRRRQIKVEDSEYLRIILTVLYTITEVIRNEQQSDNNEYCEEIEDFRSELQIPSNNDEILIIKLFEMVVQFAEIKFLAFPIKKLLLLIWKLLLVVLGGLNTARNMIFSKREKANLPISHDDPNKNTNSLTVPAQLLSKNVLENFDVLNQMARQKNVMIYYNEKYVPIIPKCLFWKPKVSLKCFRNFLQKARFRHLGFDLPNDFTTTSGLPLPVQENLKTLKEHIYVPTGQHEAQQELKFVTHPLTNKEVIDLTPNECIYRAMLPNLETYVNVLVKIVYSVTNRHRINNHVLNDLLPTTIPATQLARTKSHLDALRHQKIILKAISAIFLLLLKHFKANHVCQFEYLSQLLVSSHFMPIMLRFFYRSLKDFVSPIYVVAPLEFPNTLIGDQKELTLKDLLVGDKDKYSWMGLFTCVNCLRIMNKFMKNKDHRVTMLILAESIPVLKRVLSLKVAMCSLYSLKLIKMQIKYLGRQWQQSNLKTITLIYLKVRYHLCDDFLDVRKIDPNYLDDFTKKENGMKHFIEQFNKRRYSPDSNPELKMEDNCFISVLGKPFTLSENFKKNYRKWLEREVFRKK